MSKIWDAVGGDEIIHAIGGQGFRLIESQEMVASSEIVSSLEKQALLEEMLEMESKPGYPNGTEHLHYLLASPFRYPPLAYGSRFGGRFEPSLFYGGTSEYATLCEGAFYRFFFYYDMEEPPLHGTLQSQHTLFKFHYQTEFGVKLQSARFDNYQDILRDPVNYQATQALGSAMREVGIKGFEYRSARDQAGGINIALYDATPLTRNKPYDERQCLGQVGETEVIFSIERNITRFTLQQFLVDGALPRPSV
ncbi:MAG: RES family NAD+ phosphorylase, partial [Candidatus Thiodiazotropha sp.]